MEGATEEGAQAIGGRRGERRRMETNAFRVRFWIAYSSFPPSLPPSLGLEEKATTAPVVEAGHELVLLLSLVA